MSKLLFLSLLFLSFTVEGQDLSVSAGGEDAFCRLYEYQNGNGSVYAIPSGGSPGYEYEWKNLTTGATHTTSTWGGLNIGCYEIKLTDFDGTIARDTVCLDSINPVAEFLVVSAELDFMEWAYVGEASVNVSFEVIGEPIFSPPFFDTTCIFRPQGFEPWIAYEHPVGEFTTYEYIYGGDYLATMIAINNNGCTDTAHARIYLSGPLEIDDTDELDFFSVVSHSNSGSITVQKKGYEGGLLFNLYDLSGQEIESKKLNETENVFELSNAMGIYLYEVFDMESMEKVGTGKILF